MKLLWLKIRFFIYTISHFLILPYIYYKRSTLSFQDFKKFMSKYPIRWGSKILKWARADVEVIGLENIPSEPVVIAANHQAGFDIPLLFAKMTNQPSFIAKIELSKIPLFASWMRMIGCLFIDRSSPRKALESFKVAAELINKGQTVIIFPEGTRRPVIIPFKKGSFKLPIMAGVPVLPVTIVGTEKIIDNVKAGKRSRVILVIGKPVDISALPKEKQNSIHEDMRSLILSNFEKYSEVSSPSSSGA
ncbi:MAG: 1-acyl-sn-glycerol-3-phosphate acyltransferase [Candidatus Delongbacteria bacterium]|nr:1-acyl-sn-glycerol-3-phosphate acyltransferase [Candidatus Delongbacteria bacterium]